MKERLLSWTERSLVALLLLCFALPLLTAGGLLYPRAGESPWTLWLRNATLGGVQIAPARVPFSRRSLFTARFQKALARNYNFHFAGRELLIRLANELSLRLFRVSSEAVLVGPQGALVETDYAEEYCFARGRREDFVSLVGDLRRLQDLCDARGVAFVFLITPSKASVCPEDLPPTWLRRRRPEPRDYDRLRVLLQEKGVRYVDGHQLTLDAKAAAPVPVFPLGGLHWGQPAALVTANALLESLASRGLPVRPIRNFRVKVTWHPTGQDRDLASLLNAAIPLRYPVGEVTVEPLPAGAGSRPNLVVIGGSFLWNLLTEIDSSRQFGETEFYFYYKNSKNCVVDAEWHTVEAPVAPVNFTTDVFAADALVLEANEQILDDGAQHLRSFLRDALASPPDPHAAGVPFHSLSRMAYRWGDKLPFVLSRPDAVRETALTGFLPLTDVGADSVGPLAKVRLATPPPPAGDAILEIESGAYLADGKLPEQRVRVLVNGRDLGEWVWRTGNSDQRREVRVPAACLGGGKIDIEFLVAHPCAPADYGISPDRHPYGLLLTSLCLRPVGN